MARKAVGLADTNLVLIQVPTAQRSGSGVGSEDV